MIPLDNSIEIFIRDYVKALHEGSASIFVGAGLSVAAGFVDWSELMADIAQDLGLDIDRESDLVSLAQFHINENRNRSKINQTILNEFVDQTELTDNHKIIAHLPLRSIWTSNYDTLIEQSLASAQKVADVKHTKEQLLTNHPNRDVIVYKMHGDVNHSTSAILSKEDYERYPQTHGPFVDALTGELTTKTFLFLGFSFSDPNLDYVLSRLNQRFAEHKQQHYSLLKRHQLHDPQNPDQATLDYNLRKQALLINDLSQRYGVKALLIDSYADITVILAKIESLFRKKTVFIAGSAASYAPIDDAEALNFIHLLSKNLVKANFRVVSGFGVGVGSSVINGALEAIEEKPLKVSESQLILKPFPQFESGSKSLKELWDDYRHRMVSLSGIAIFVFGNKTQDGQLVVAEGVLREYEIAVKNGCLCIPIGCTGYAAAEIAKQILGGECDHLDGQAALKPNISRLADTQTPLMDQMDGVLKTLSFLVP